MSGAFILPLMTTEQFFELPEPRGDFTYELHFGELVEVGRAKKKHLLVPPISALPCDRPGMPFPTRAISSAPPILSCK
jgi:hypothetical protein